MAKRKTTKKKKSSVRHTRAIQRDRRKRPIVSPPDEKIEQRLQELLEPAIESQKAKEKALGLRSRLLPLSVMVAIVVSMIWRQVGGGGTEISRLLATEGLLWVSVLQVSQQAISSRLRTFPPILFLGILNTLLPVLQERHKKRQRPLTEHLTWAKQKYTDVLAADGSTLDALMRQVGLLRGEETHPLAGKTMALLDVCSWLPLSLWYDEKPSTHDQKFWPQLLEAIPRGCLLLLDAGFVNFASFLQLTSQNVTFIIPAATHINYECHRWLTKTDYVHDLLVYIGSGSQRQLLRLVTVYYHGESYSYLTNELDPLVLPPHRLASLYWQRWRIEDAFHIVKRLLGLAYFWTGSVYGVLLQLWGTWILYAILVDLTDDIADALNRPFADISIEMVYRSLYYFSQAFHRGRADDPVSFLAENARLFGILKRQRQPSHDHEPPEPPEPIPLPHFLQSIPLPDS